MEERKLTKADIDKVRHIEGFPIGKDEDIIALSRPPYYTACPNPFIEDFIRENGTPYDEATDDYHREPFAADVSEGKKDPIYNAHSYHTKVPYKAIMRYILHYTNPGDIVFDGFCGTGMTAVAAQMCGSPDLSFKLQLEAEMDKGIQWGHRKAVVSDLSPMATFIASDYTMRVDPHKLESLAKKVIQSVVDEYGWMYTTAHLINGVPQHSIDGSPQKGHVDYTVWSDVFVCPSCSHEIVFFNSALNAEGGVLDKFPCPHCGSVVTKKECERAFVSEFDSLLGQTVKKAKQVPVLIEYAVGRDTYQKEPDQEDLSLFAKINDILITEWIPTDRMPDGGEGRRNDKVGITNIHQFFTKRAQIILSVLWASVSHLENVSTDEKNALYSIITGVMQGVSKLQRFRMNSTFPNMILSGTLYIGSMVREWNILDWASGKTKSIVKMKSAISKFDDNVRISTGSSTSLTNIASNSIDYIFTDPPFGGNLNYAELSFMWESWLKVVTAIDKEAIVDAVHKKGLVEYEGLMEACFREFYRILKPARWITIEFHNSQNAVWNAIQEALQRVGFVVADIRVLDKKQSSFKQIVSQAAVKQDLVISAYKPKESFVREFQKNAGDPEMAWEFVRQHLRNVPVVADGNHDGKLDIIAERQDYLLFDRMVAWHIMNGIPVPMDAHTFYDGLRQRFLQRDGMFFLPDQVNEYDDKRAHMELDAQQLSFLVTDEKNAIAWLNYILGEGPKTYQEIQPAYLQELHQSKQEKMPELLDMLRENFVQDDKGAWYVPDLSNAADLAKVRRKALLKEFYDSCVPGKGKLKVFRMEAIRAGFDECWKQRDFKTIVSVGERLPEAVLQEDPALLMYYDNACSRV